MQDRRFSKILRSVAGSIIGFGAPMYALHGHIYDAFSYLNQEGIFSNHFHTSVKNSFISLIATAYPHVYLQTILEGGVRAYQYDSASLFDFLKQYKQHGILACSYPVPPLLFPVYSEEMDQTINHFQGLAISDTYYEEIQQAMAWVPEEVKPVEQKAISVAEINQSILARIEVLPPPVDVTLLDAKEIRAYENQVKTDQDAERLLLQLKKYQSYIESRCSISRSKIKEKDQKQLLTIKTHDAKENGVYTFIVHAVKEYIQFCTEHQMIANVPSRTFNLTDERTAFHLGLDPSMIQFIHDVRATNHLSLQVTEGMLRDKRIKYYQQSGVCRVRESQAELKPLMFDLESIELLKNK
jgi:hypothetical protein